MTELSDTPRWQTRIKKIRTLAREIKMPDTNGERLPQNEEWCEVAVNGDRRRIRFHDYDQIFSIPGLYEQLFYQRLKCCSPFRVTRILADVLEDFDDDFTDLRVLDIGAGNGMVGDELAALGVPTLIGIDIIHEARDAAFRDRPELYEDYMVVDLTKPPTPVIDKLRDYRLNCLTTVAALGFEDIPPRAFLTALDVIDTPGWIAFNIKEDFLHEYDTSGFSRAIRRLSKEYIIQPQAYRRYQHRLSMNGDSLHYVAMVARKLRPVPAEFFDIK